MDLFLAYMLYKYRNNVPDATPNYLETTLAILVLIAGLAQIASVCCKGRN